MADDDPIEAIIEGLEAPHLSSILVRRRDPTPRRWLSNRPPEPASEFVADTGPRIRGLSEREADELVRRGATRQGEPQRIEVPPIPPSELRSLRCAYCHAWFSIFASTQSGVCDYQHRFEVRFVEGASDAKMPREQRCGHYCEGPATRFSLGMNPNQVTCNQCSCVARYV